MATYPLPVVRKSAEGPDAASLWLDVPKDLSGVFGYRPGQFVAVEKRQAGEVLVRQYSLSSTPGADIGLRITVKKIPNGRVSTWLVDQVAAGDILEVAAPRGLFYKPLEQPRHVLLLCAGSGVAPMIPIARSLIDSDLGHHVTFAAGNRTEESILLRSDVEALGKHSGVHLEHVLSRPGADWQGARGRLDRTYLTERLPVWEARRNLPMMAYLCGPKAFMDAAEEALLAFGLGAADIRRESFDLVLNDQEDEPPLEVAAAAPGEDGACERITAVVGGEEYSVVPEPSENMLAALLRANADVPFSCLEGTCASCISKLTEGRAAVRPGVLQTLRQDDLDDGLLLACLSHPLTRHVRIDFDDL